MLGASSVSRFGHTLGIKTPLLPNLTLALGSSDVTLIDLTAAYSVFPNRGKLINPYCIMEVLDQNERVIWRVKPRKKIVMSRAKASIITNMLKGVIEEGTGRMCFRVMIFTKLSIRICTRSIKISDDNRLQSIS